MTTTHKLKKKQIRSAKLKKAKQKQIQKKNEITKLKNMLKTMKSFEKDIESLKGLFDNNEIDGNIRTKDIVNEDVSGSSSIAFEDNTENPFR